MARPQLASVVINARDVDLVAAFWSAFLEIGERQRMGDAFVWLERAPGIGTTIAVQKVEDPTEGRNRLHLDFGAPDLAAAAQRVKELGGTQIEGHQMGDFRWIVFGDTEGNEFCVAEADPDQHT